MNQNRINNEIILELIKEESHGRELAKKLKTPLTSIQRLLIKLEKNNIVDFKYKGKNKTYYLKNNLKTKRCVFNAENYKLIHLLGKYPALEPILDSIINKTKSNLVVLFGSYAKFRAKKDSDIDIYIETRDSRIKKDVELINSRLSVKIGSFDKESILVKEIIKNHIIIKGVEEYYEKIKFLE